VEQRKILLNGKIERSPNGFYKTEVFINMKVSKSACSSSNPCSGYGSDVSGCLGSSNLKSIGIGNNVLAKEAADAFIKMTDDMPSNLKSKISMGGAYRPLNIQCNIFDWGKYESTGKRVKKGTSSTPAAYPGTSNHGWGRAIDISPSDVQNWIRENGTKYGWCWGEAKSEPWHFTFCGPGSNRDKNCDSFCKGKMTVDTSSDKKETSTEKEEKSTDKKDTSTDGKDKKKKFDPFFSSLDAIVALGKGDVKGLEDYVSSSADMIGLSEDVDRIKDIMKKIL
jgi:hypothetical protein